MWKAIEFLLPSNQRSTSTFIKLGERTPKPAEDIRNSSGYPCKQQKRVFPSTPVSFLVIIDWRKWVCTEVSGSADLEGRWKQRMRRWRTSPRTLNSSLYRRAKFSLSHPRKLNAGCWVVMAKVSAASSVNPDNEGIMTPSYFTKMFCRLTNEWA